MLVHSSKAQISHGTLLKMIFDFCEYEQGRSSSIVVAGRLKSHIHFWRSIAGQFILDVIEHGYRIPFHSIPPVSFSSNNKSAFGFC